MALIFSTGLSNALAGKDVPQANSPPAAGAAITGGCSFKTAMQLGFLDIFPLPRPASADLVEGVTRLVRISLTGTATGLSFEATADIAAGKVQKIAADIWQGIVSLTGVAGWFRFYSAVDPGGASTAHLRFDGTVGTTSASDLMLATTSLVATAPLIIGTFDVQLPLLT